MSILLDAEDGVIEALKPVSANVELLLITSVEYVALTTCKIFPGNTGCAEMPVALMPVTVPDPLIVIGIRQCSRIDRMGW